MVFCLLFELQYHKRVYEWFRTTCATDSVTLHPPCLTIMRSKITGMIVDTLVYILPNELSTFLRWTRHHLTDPPTPTSPEEFHSLLSRPCTARPPHPLQLRTHSTLTMRSALCLLALLAFASATVHFKETFDSMLTPHNLQLTPFLQRIGNPDG